MSTQVNKLDTEAGGRFTRVSEVRPAAVKPQEKVSWPIDEPSSSYAAMLREAYDGDSAEAMAVTAGPRRALESSEQSHLAAALETPRKASQKVAPVDQDRKPAEFLERLHGREGASPVAGGEPASQAPAARQLHDRLVLVSSKMEVSEIATHVALRPFMRLMQILSQQNWKRPNNLRLGSGAY